MSRDFSQVSTVYLFSLVLNCFLIGAAYSETSGLPLGAAREWTANLDSAHRVDVTQDGAALCNSVAFSQVPGHRELFLGRVKENTNDNKCSGNNWALALFQMDWTKMDLHFVRYILKPPFTVPGDGRVINSAYDPYAIEFKGELWAAFECAASDSVSSCIGPVDLEKGMDNGRISLPASGGPKSNSDPWVVSASDPKLLSFRERLYLYWTVIRSDEHGWHDAAVRGAELVGNEGARKSLWLKDAGSRAVRSNDNKMTVATWSPSANDPLSDSVADVFGLYPNGNSIIASAGLGGHGKAAGESCLSPGGSSQGCYRLTIARASDPLARDAFSGADIHTVGFPENPQEYSRVVQSPDGSLFVMGMYMEPPAKYAAQYKGHALPRGLMIYPISVK